MILPAKNRVVILPDPAEQVVGGIYVNNYTRKEGGTLRWGTIESVGDVDEEHADTRLKAGVRVLYNDYDGYEIQNDNEKRLVIPTVGIYAFEKA